MTMNMFVRPLESHCRRFTRLSTRGQKGIEVVFDVAGSEHYLSEIFPPDSDGFMVTGAPGEHTHVSAKGK